MEISKKKLVAIVIIVVVVIVTLLLILLGNDENKNEAPNNNDTYEEYVQKLEDGSKVNVSGKLLETKTYNGLEITDISLSGKNNVTYLVAKVTNKTNREQQEQKITVILEDKDGKEIARIKGIIDKVEPSESVQLNITTTKDIVNAYNFNIVEGH